jgi:hypothetical protein
VCRFQVGSFNYDISKLIFYDEFIADENQIRSLGLACTYICREKARANLTTSDFTHNYNVHVVIGYVPRAFFQVQENIFSKRWRLNEWRCKNYQHYE